jgi:hypothetical protein
MQIFQGISGETDLALEGGTVDAARLYVEPRWGVVVAGPLTARIRAHLTNGVVTPKTQIDVSSDLLEVRRPSLAVRGTWNVKLEKNDPRAAPRLDAVLERATLLLPNGAAKAPQIDRAATAVDFSSLDVTRPIEWKQVALALNIALPDLSALEVLLTTDGPHHFRGAAQGHLEGVVHATGAGNGTASIRLEDAQWRSSDFLVRSTGGVLSRFELVPNSTPTAVRGVVSLDVSGADSLLSLAVAEPFQSMIAGALDVDRMRADIAVHATANRVDLELTDARSGTARGRGHFRYLRGTVPKATALLSTAAIRVGLALEGKNVRVAPFVTEQWLADTWQDMMAGHSPSQ